jgi:hypothetical protein
MRFWKDVGVSSVGAIAITCLSVLFSKQGGDLLAIPGIILEGWVNIVILLVSDDPYISFNRAWLFLNTLFFAILIFLCLTFTRRIRGWTVARTVGVKGKGVKFPTSTTIDDHSSQ